MLIINAACTFSLLFLLRNYVMIFWLARVIVILICEAWLPLLHVFVAYPLAGMFGRVGACLQVSLFLIMNNLCYVSIGSFLGMYDDRSSRVMI